MKDVWNNPKNNEPYKPFAGPNILEMPKLIAEGRNPISPQHLYYLKLEALNECRGHNPLRLNKSEEKNLELCRFFRSTYWDRPITTGFGVAVHPDKGYKMTPDLQLIRTINLDTKLLNGAAVMPDGMFESIEGTVYTRKDIKKHGNKDLLLKEALKNPFLRELIPDNVTRRLAIINIFEEGRLLLGYERMAGVYFPGASIHPFMRLWYIGRLRGQKAMVSAGDLDDESGLLIGSHKGVCEGDASKLEHILKRCF